MAKVLAYLRTSTDKQDLNNQKLEILEYGRQAGIHIHDFIAISISSKRSDHDRRLDELLARLVSGDTLVVTEISRLGRSTGQVINLIDKLMASGISIIIIKPNLVLDTTQDDIQSLTMITMLALFAQLERVMISRRTKEALATKKAQGIQLGKPKGTVQNSIYDKDRKRIVQLLSFGVSARHISTQHLGYGYPSSLNYYINTRHLRDEAKQIRLDARC
ncbi:recombinase family protein [Candidatus Poribacteria bacterium]|nr:recombinase family protein [Candidatus Poribacteria bacterium]